MTTLRHLLAASLLMCGGAVPAVAQTASGTSQPPPRSGLEHLLADRPVIDKTLTAEEAVAIALRENPTVRSVAAAARAAHGQVDAARAMRRPYVTANTFLSGGSDTGIVSSPALIPPSALMALPRDAFADQNLMVMVPLYTAGRLNALVRQATAAQKTTDAEQERIRQEVALQVRTAIWETLARRAMVTVQETTVQENEERLRLDRARLAQDAIPAYYVQRDEAEVASARQGLTNARRDAAIGLLQVKTMLGVHPDSKLDLAAPPDEDEPTVEAVVARLAGDRGTGGDARTSLLRVATRNRPELTAAAQRIQEREAALTAVRGGYGPQVSLFGMGDAMKSRRMPATGGVTFGAIASFPLYSGGQRQADLETATAQREKERADADQIALQAAQEIDSALLNLRAAAENVGTAKTALAAAVEEYRISQTRYQAGRSVVTEVLDAQAARARAEGNLIQARFAYRTAQAQLARAVGAGLP